MLNKVQIDAKIRKLLMNQLTKSPKLTVLKAGKLALADNEGLEQPIKHQLELLVRKCASKRPEDKRIVKDYLTNDLCLKVDDSTNDYLVLFTEAYDDDTWMFDDDFAMLSPSLRDYFEEIKDAYPEASHGKVVELAVGVGIPGAEELLGMNNKELEELFANSSIG